MKPTKELLNKYNVPVPRYTSYPPANYFVDSLEQAEIQKAVFQSNKDDPQNISIYIHIPFCAKLCYYCGCNTHISRDKKLINSYIESLKGEIRLVSGMLKDSRKVSQIHWGGGTPNYLPSETIKNIMQLIKKSFKFIDKPEIAIECHPYHLTYEYIDQLIEIGFNRMSIGIQDFNDLVMKTINREQSQIPIPEMVEYIRSNSDISINLDFIYGLPYQNEETFSDTIKKAIAINPDRLVTFSYAHVPWVKKTQQILEQYDLPDADQKLALFQKGSALLKAAGYESIGLDHFAKKDDELNLALQAKSLHRNFQGYCTRETTGQVYAFGVSGISQLESAYLQSTKDIKAYQESIAKGELPIEKVYFLNKDEKIIRGLINSLMCNFYLSWNTLSQQFSTPIPEIHKALAFDKHLLSNFIDEKLIEVTEDEIFVTELGKFFIRNIAASFDPKMNNTKKNFSKAL